MISSLLLGPGDAEPRVSRSDLHDRLYGEIDAYVGPMWRSWTRQRLEARTERFLRDQLLLIRAAIDRVITEDPEDHPYAG